MKKIISEFDKNNPGVYLLHNPNTDETYFGSTTNLNRRANEHNSELNNKKHGNYKLQDAFNKDSNFEFIGVGIRGSDNIIENKLLGLEIEQDLINTFKDNNLLLNIATETENGTLGFRHTEETKKLISQKSKGRIPSEETRKKLSLAKLGNKNGLGYRHTDEAKQKMSISNLGNKKALGHKHDEETRKRISESHKGKFQSKEHIEKSAEGRTKRRVVINETEYQNATVASKVIGITRDGINKRCLSDNFPEYSFKDKK